MSSDEPKSAKMNMATWDAWKFYETLTPEEIMVLIGKRKQDLKYENDAERKKELKTDIAILIDAYEIVKKRRI